MVTGGLTSYEGVAYYRIDGIEEMDPFLVTVASDSDLWMWVSTSGALTAGRTDPNHALFPYETDDRLHRAAGITGPVTVVVREAEGEREVWQPFSRVPSPAASRSVAKSLLGDRLVMEEHHREWSLVWRTTWMPSGVHGWVRTVELVDRGGVSGRYEVLDGFLDVMPAGVDARIEQTRSNLVDAYKRSEVVSPGRLAVYSLEALITDRAEPAESLTATVVWSSGFDAAELDLDERAVAAMVSARPRTPSRLVTGRPGAYLLRGPVDVPASGSVGWALVADTSLDHAAVLSRVSTAAGPVALDQVIDDVEFGSRRLRAFVEDADAVQSTADPAADAHHMSNVLFNSMRGGTFPYGSRLPVVDLAAFVEQRNHAVFGAHADLFASLGAWIDVSELRARMLAIGDPDLIRLTLEYLPLTFSRRHGDPSRPWNSFSIAPRRDDGEALSYEGNWRDIFQNWEGLLHSYPGYLVNVVATFVNASTRDGYNAYRISRGGIDWEIPDPDDPWSHIGYWGDHQIVYLLRLLEMWERYEPGAIGEWLDRPVFVFADVPYAIADHDAMVRDPRNTITYEPSRASRIARREDLVGSDGRLAVDGEGGLVRAGLLEKLLVPALAKLSNFVPDGGIWLNTQRPEWNDANNALAGPGLSMVTLYHLRRYLGLVRSLTDRHGIETVVLSSTVAAWLADQREVLGPLAREPAPVDDVGRRTVVDRLGRSAADHRHRVASGSGDVKVGVPVAAVRDLCIAAIGCLDQAIVSARREDGLYHSYHRVSFPTHDTAQVDHLGPMLEGQVAVLSSGALDADASLAVVDALYESDMYRPDQDTFMLYPATRLPGFLDRNAVAAEDAGRLRALGPTHGPLGSVFVADERGGLHFRPQIVNARSLETVLDGLELSEADRSLILDVHERVFHHHSFTGRSTSMYGYEGLGSVYWHMVAKLLLAVQEAYWAAVDRGDSEHAVTSLADAYRRIRAGMGFRKDPATFGAIPTDCYSHTPAHAGAQQPGMTGQVKEEILTRFGELGFRVVAGRATLSPGLILPDEMFPLAVDGTWGPATFTVCSVPMVVASGAADAITVVRADGTRVEHPGLVLGSMESQELFDRAGSIVSIEWGVGESTMRRWAKRSSGDVARRQ